jgi:hypothetical protein
MLTLEDLQAVVDAAAAEYEANPRTESKKEVLAQIIARGPISDKLLADGKRRISCLDMNNPDDQYEFALIILQFQIEAELLKLGKQILEEGPKSESNMS